MNIDVVIYLVMGVVICAVGIVILRIAPDSAQGYQRAEAVVEDVMLGDTPNTVKPLVSFVADGERVTRSMVSVDEKSFANETSTIWVLWKKTTVGGMETWSVLPDSDSMPQLRATVMKWVGILFLAIGAVIIGITSISTFIKTR